MSAILHRNEESSESLFAIAEGQQGYFTAKHAETAGFDKTSQHYHLRAGQETAVGS
jgi:hypothetical protein